MSKELWTTEEVRGALHEILGRMINLSLEKMSIEKAYSEEYLETFLKDAREELTEEPTNETN